MANVYDDLGDKKLALQYYLKSISIRLQKLDKSHVNTAN